MVKLDAANSVALTMFGLCEFGVRDFDNSLAHLRSGQKIGVGNPGIDTVSKYHLAMLLTRAGDFEQALGVPVRMAQSGKQSPAYLMLAGRAFWEAAQRHVPEAQAAYADPLSRYRTVFAGAAGGQKCESCRGPVLPSRLYRHGDGAGASRERPYPRRTP